MWVGRAVSHGGDTLGARASMGKVAILVTFLRAIGDGEYPLADLVHIPATGRTPRPVWTVRADL
jgi:beta-lactamase class A